MFFDRGDATAVESQGAAEDVYISQFAGPFSHSTKPQSIEREMFSSDKVSKVPSPKSFAHLAPGPPPPRLCFCIAAFLCESVKPLA